MCAYCDEHGREELSGGEGAAGGCMSGKLAPPDERHHTLTCQDLNSDLDLGHAPSHLVILQQQV